MPIARALRARGHEVLFTCQTAMLETVRAAGFEAVDSGGPSLTSAEYRGPLVPVDRTAEGEVLRTGFAGRIAAQRAPRIVAAGESFGADVVVRDEVDFGAAVAAERLGIPHASVIVLAAGGMLTPELVDEPLQTLRGELGLAPDHGFLNRYLTISPVMPSFRGAPLPGQQQRVPSGAAPDPGPAGAPSPVPGPAGASSPGPGPAGAPASLVIRPEVSAEAHSGLASWLEGQPERPLVYFTLGTIFHQESGDLFPRVLAGLEQLDANVLVTVGREVDPAELGTRKDNVLVERFVPQGAILPQAAAVVSHAGSGTVVSSLACGVPLVLLPLGADQPWNADRCEALGVGQVLDPLTVSSAEVAASVDEVLTSATYREAARSLQAEAESLPTAEAAADAVEKLTGER
ncbi:glycosyltransferase [Kribbella sp. NPDC051770]|uniref:glycosyltransferase n=1 Tax=Kribbella sp. NPDC051770 TaxID=3155413 RepID=UPI003438C894